MNWKYLFSPCVISRSYQRSSRIQQQMIELRALHLERAAIRIAQTLIEAEAEADAAVAGDEVRAVLRKVIAFQQLIGNAEAGEEVVAVRQQRLADLKTRKAFALEKRYGEAALCEKGRGRRSRGTSANDDDVTHSRSSNLVVARCYSACSIDFS